MESTLPEPLFKLPRDFYSRPTLQVARELLGAILVRRYGNELLSGIIVETEAYLGETDPASHAYRGRTPRTKIMFGPPGVAYVYFIYGKYYCLNFVTEPPGKAAAVLIRALQPLTGIGVMKRLRNCREVRSLTNGPGKLCQALAIDLKLNGTDLTGDNLFVARGDETFPGGAQTVARPRVGIRQGTAHLWRFYIEGNPFVSVL